MRTPYDYQITGSLFLQNKRRAGLFDEPGLGKTQQGVMTVDAINAPSVLVICPAVAVPTWREEFKTAAAKTWTLGNNLHIYSYDMIRKAAEVTYDERPRRKKATKTIAAARLPFDVHTVIIDEAHYLKNNEAIRTQIILGPRCNLANGILEKAERVYALTGTPMPNNPSELWTLLRALAPECILNTQNTPMSLWEFRSRYCRMKFNGFADVIEGGKNLNELRKRITPFYIRRKKVDVLPDLPPLRYGTLFIDPDPSVVRGLAADMAVISDLIDNLDDDAAFAALHDAPQHYATLRRRIALAKVPPVAEFVAEELENNPMKYVIFAHHTEVVDSIAELLSRYGTALIRGSTPQEERGKQVHRFQNDPHCRVFVGNIRAAGTAITLTAASNVIFVEASYTPVENQQAAQRCHRIGQRDSVLARFAQIPGTIDQRVMDILRRKTISIEGVFG